MERDNNIQTELNSEYEVKDSEVQNKSGNYLFTVGNVSAGKSTLQNLIIYRLWRREDIDVEYNSKEGDYRHDGILDKWVTRLQAGYLPNRTEQGKLQEFTIRVAQENKKKLDLSFLEISGEDIKSIIPDVGSTQKPKVNKLLVDYLSSNKKKINKRFIFVSDASANRKKKSNYKASEISEDILFNHFLRYLLSKNGINLKRIRILFIVSKWDIINKEYKSVREYLNKNFTQTRAVLKQDRCDVSYLKFSVGEVSFNEKENKEKIVRLDYS